MKFHLIAAGVVLHAVYWGAGLAVLGSPARWRRWWWAAAPGFGIALQSAVVWLAAHVGFCGTDSYAWQAELVPAVLLVIAWLRCRGWRRLRDAVRGSSGMAAVMAIAGWMLVSPMAESSHALTSTSLGSCDHADYAAGARVLKEFSKDDRVGFLGLPEVTRVRSAETFFDFWLRLNHFTPPAVVAENATVFGLEPHKLISLTSAAFALMNLPIVLLLARVVVGIRGLPLVGVVAIYAFSPIQAYAVHHGALGQLLAAQGIALLTVGGVLAAREAAAGRSPWRWFLWISLALWLLAGSYNFILVVCLAPLGFWLALEGWRRRNFALPVRIALVVAAALCTVAALFWGRFNGLAERFSLFDEYDFGWVVPLASPEGWMGILKNPSLAGWQTGVRWLLSAILVLVWLVGLGALGRRRGPSAVRRPEDVPLSGNRIREAVALVIPVVAGWGILAFESRSRANASYDAYKLLSVFHPELLAGLCCWLPAARQAGGWWPKRAGLLLAAILVGNLGAAARFRSRMQHPPLTVDHSLVDLQLIDSDPRIRSVNMRIGNFWSRLWANAFLLRKPQYFPTHTYEGRMNTPLRGDWDLSDSILCVVPENPGDFVRLNQRFHLGRAGASPLRLEFGNGWHELETSGDQDWRWAGERGVVRVTNTGTSAVEARITARVRGADARGLRLLVNGRPAGTWPIDGTIRDLAFGAVSLPPGVTELAFETDRPPLVPGGGDGRRLTTALFRLDVGGGEPVMRVASPEHRPGADRGK